MLNIAKIHDHQPARLTSHLKTSAILGGIFLASAIGVQAQTADDSADVLAAPVASAASSSSLPEAPLPAESDLLNPEDAFQVTQPQGSKPLPMAGHYDKYIQPGQAAPRLSVGDKVVLGLRDAFGPFSAVGWVASAGYAQALDNSPNYGQTGKGFAQRLGASAARASSEGIFSDSVLAPILHEDPRYYKMGNGHNFVKRLVYSGTRTLVTRTDGGHLTPNFALLGGNLAGSALTQAYYPPLNRGFSQVLQTFGGSIGGSALGFVVSEFLADALHGLHITK